MCQALFPVLEELGLRYQNHSTVTIAKIDVTANDLQLADLDRHPFFRLFPANSQQVRAPGLSGWTSGHVITRDACSPRPSPAFARPAPRSALALFLFPAQFRGCLPCAPTIVPDSLSLGPV